MIDPIYRQQLVDQVDQMRQLLDILATNFNCMELTASLDGRKETVAFCGSEIARLGSQIKDLAPELCETAEKFEFMEVQP